MFKGLIIACLAGTPIQDCKPDNRQAVIDVFRPPTKLYQSLFQCQFESQAYAADVVPAGSVLKVYCGSVTKQGNPGA